MRRSLPFAILASAIAAVSLAAQTPNSSSANAAAGGTPNHVTVTGCIERADTVAASPRAPADPDSLEYVLVRPSAEQSNSGASPVATGTSGESSVMYRLSGDQQKLNPHVGHKVEITGSPSAIEPSAAAASGAISTMPSGAAPGLMVENVRMIDASCSSK
jgi:hypothetical protein